MNTTDFSPLWNTLTVELDARYQNFRSEIEASWNSLDTILQKHAEAARIENWPEPAAGNLSSILEFTKDASARLLRDPLQSLKKARPQERVLKAIESYQSGTEDLLRRLPKSIDVSRKDLEKNLEWSRRRLRFLFLRLGGKPRSLSMRAAVHGALMEQSVARAKYDGKLLLLLSRGMLSLVIPWQFIRNDALKALGGGRSDPQSLEQTHDHWLRLVADFRTSGLRVLASYDLWRRKLFGHLTAALLTGDSKLADRRKNRAADRWQKYFRYWANRQRVVLAQLELEAVSARLLVGAVEMSIRSLASVDDEHLQIFSELDRVNRCLEHWQFGDMDEPFPPPEARLVSSEDRTAEWIQNLESSGRAELPVHMESVDLRHVLPGGRKQPQTLEVASRFVKALCEASRETALSGFDEAVEGHRAIIREIERAREVAEYSIEAGQGEEENEEDVLVAREGIANALALLEYQKKSAAEYHPIVEQRLVEALSSAFFRFHLMMEEGRFGLFRQVARQKGRQAVRRGLAAVLSESRAGFQWFSNRFGQVNSFFLMKLGWVPPSSVAIEPVARREYLGEILNLKVGPRELPAIYKRLFRLAPVEDPRFLVGRGAEMAAAAHARDLWKEGRSVSILLAGARGSGKTSFLNCARTSIFGDLQTVSGQFGQRIHTAENMHGFLSSLIHCDPRDLEPNLHSNRRLIVLEEVERTYIRRIGGFKALLALLDLISATSKSTLWVLSLNEAALSYLTRAIGIQEHFSHRINAMAVAPEHLRNAILLRHNLSGLRLHFAPAQDPSSRGGKLRTILGFAKEDEQVFFESLYGQSEGIFRSAFELWQQSVDRVEGGVLYMLQPTVAHYDGMISRLSLEDSFLLQAILQHGSLTPEEASLIFDAPLDRSGNRLEKMIAWEVIEPDPSNPGFRIRPEAGRLVREALYRQNLL